MAPKKKPARELSKRQLYRRAAHYNQLLHDHDFGKKDGLIAAGIVGGALATALALRAAKHHNNKLTDAEGREVSGHDSPAQFMRNRTSIVAATGASASFPEGEEEAEQLRRTGTDDASVFVQEPGGRTTYVVRDGLETSPVYRRAIDYGAELARRALPSRVQRPEMPYDDPSHKE